MPTLALSKAEGDWLLWSPTPPVETIQCFYEQEHIGTLEAVLSTRDTLDQPFQPDRDLAAWLADEFRTTQYLWKEHRAPLEVWNSLLSGVSARKRERANRHEAA